MKIIVAGQNKNYMKIKKLISWFSVTRIILIFWNVAAFLYHYLFIGIDGWTSFVMQIVALFMELAIAGWYEKLLVQGNKIVNKTLKKRFASYLWLHAILPKYLVYTTLFAGFYGLTYTIRLLFFYEINWGVTERSVIASMTNMIVFMFVAGWMMGSLVILRKARKISFKKLILWTNSLRKFTFLKI
jgi:hypothetical protein